MTSGTVDLTSLKKSDVLKPTSHLAYEFYRFSLVCLSEERFGGVLDAMDHG